MKIEDLVAGKKDTDHVQVEWASLPASALKALMQEGYVHLRPYQEEKTFSIWGKTCTACLTEDQLLQRAGQK